MLALLMALPLTALALPLQVAQASPAPASDSGVASRAVIRRLNSSDGTLVTGWRPLTAQEKKLKAAGRLTTAALSGPGATPQIAMSASGCSERVCITIYGDGLYISEWDTRALWDGDYICTQSAWWNPKYLPIRYGNGVCGGSGVFFSYWQPKRNFKQALACNTWYGIPGKPCESVYP